MTTYNLAVYSALYGPIAIEKVDSKEDLLKKMVDYINKYWPNAIEPFIKTLNPNIQYPVVDNHPQEPLVFFKFNKNSSEANLEFLYRNRENGEEFVIFAKAD